MKCPDASKDGSKFTQFSFNVMMMMSRWRLENGSTLRYSASTLHVDNGSEDSRECCEQATETRRPASLASS